MTVLINASPTNGLQMTSDGSGIVKLQSNSVTTNALAWVNFAGSRSVTPRSSYNVSSITSSAVGTFTINFTNALTDANYCAVISGSSVNAGGAVSGFTNSTTAPTTSAYNFFVSSGWTVGVTSSTGQDCPYTTVVIFGN